MDYQDILYARVQGYAIGGGNNECVPLAQLDETVQAWADELAAP